VRGTAVRTGWLPGGPVGLVAERDGRTEASWYSQYVVCKCNEDNYFGGNMIYKLRTDKGVEASLGLHCHLE
jgi:hypothetical protein